jgi:hypothetical protein
MVLLAFLVCAQAFGGMPEGRFNPGFRGGYRGGYGFRGGYGYRGGYYGRPGWYRGGFGWGPGWFLPALPLGCVTIGFGGAAWYYGGGYWYQPYGGGYMVALPPVGIAVSVLPSGCSTLVVGGVTYYCANDVYYTAVPGGTGYVVAAPPPGQPRAGSLDAVALDALVIIPRNGQSDDKIMSDRRDAQRFAMDQSSYDPADSDPADPGTPRARQAYLRAMKTYLEGKGYTVK